MPEYPEVSTVRHVLNTKIVGKQIAGVDVMFDKILKNINAVDFVEKLNGQYILSIINLGKYLILSLTDYDLVIHLRMEGKLFYYEKDYNFKKHDHIVITMTDGSSLVYNDVRKFGTFDLYNKGEYNKAKQIVKLGKEPLDQTLDIKYLKSHLMNNKKIKQNLLDQTIINGLGNIYVDEILYASKIHPETTSKNLTDKNIANIIKNMRRIIKEAVKEGGTTIKSFAASDQIKGNFQKYLKVYQKNGTKCSECKETIQKIKVGGRGTHFCPNCQRKI